MLGNAKEWWFCLTCNIFRVPYNGKLCRAERQTLPLRWMKVILTAHSLLSLCHWAPWCGVPVPLMTHNVGWRSHQQLWMIFKVNCLIITANKQMLAIYTAGEVPHLEKNSRQPTRGIHLIWKMSVCPSSPTRGYVTSFTIQLCPVTNCQLSTVCNGQSLLGGCLASQAKNGIASHSNWVFPCHLIGTIAEEILIYLIFKIV